MNASPGAAVGKAVFDSRPPWSGPSSGEKVILVRRETNPDDLHGMVAAAGILTSRGGKTSHAAVVARGMGRTCVCGADDLDVDVRHGRFRTADGVEVDEGDVISIDGTTGEVFLGEVPVMDSAGRALLRGRRERSRRRAGRGRGAAHGARRRHPAAGGARQRRQPRRRGAGAPVRRPGHRAVPHRAHVPRRPPRAGRAPDPGRHRRGAREGAARPCCRCSARTSRRSSRRWTGCR